jgi:hypothetical protein
MSKSAEKPLPDTIRVAVLEWHACGAGDITQRSGFSGSDRG